MATLEHISIRIGATTQRFSKPPIGPFAVRTESRSICGVLMLETSLCVLYRQTFLCLKLDKNVGNPTKGARSAPTLRTGSAAQAARKYGMQLASMS